jgi:hypothetical protein
MQSKLIITVLALALCAAASWAETGAGAPSDPLKQLEIRAGAVKSGKASEYAPDALKEALSGVAAAQAAAAGGSQRFTQQRIELAELLLNIADAKAAERELLEKVAVQRVELKKLEAQLEKNLQGEVKP